jgi:hypothetical protein
MSTNVRALLGAVALTVPLVLASCGGVDRAGTRDQLVDQFEAAGLTADPDCIDDALDQYSDDELEALDKALEDGGSSDDAAALLTSIMECATAP